MEKNQKQHLSERAVMSSGRGRGPIQIGMHDSEAGGLDRYVHGLCRAFDRMGEPYHGLVFSRAGDLGTGDLPGGIEVLGGAGDPLWQRWQRIRGVIQRAIAYQGHPRVVSHFALYGLPATTFWQGRKRIRLISHFHGPWADESAAEGASKVTVLAKRLMERRVYQRSSHVLSDSEAFRQLAIARYGLRPGRVTVGPMGIDAVEFGTKALGISRREARERLGWPVDPGRRIVFCVRRITRRMGLENLIDAVHALADSHSELLVMIGGKGPILDELRARVQRQGLENQVRLLGFVPDAELPLAYRAADFTMVPSVALEGFGLVILESWAAGTPAIVTPVGGMPEVVSPLAPDCVLEGSGVENLVRGLQEVFRGARTLPEPEACVEHVRRAHDWQVAARQILQVYA